MKAVTLFTQNMYMPAVGFGCMRMRRAQRYSMLVDFIAGNLDIDVICLQELFVLNMALCSYGKSDINHLVAELRDIGYYYVARAPHSSRYGTQNSGLVTFSRVPITGSNFYPFPNQEPISKKGVLVTHLEGGITVLNTHLPVGHISRRQTAFEELERVVGLNSPRTMILAGDLNIKLHEQPWIPYFRKWYDVSGPTTRGTCFDKFTIDSSGTVHPIDVGEKIDFVMIRETSSCRYEFSIIDRRFSDHCGICARLEFDK